MQVGWKENQECGPEAKKRVSNKEGMLTFYLALINCESSTLVLNKKLQRGKNYFLFTLVPSPLNISEAQFMFTDLTISKQAVGGSQLAQVNVIWAGSHLSQFHSLETDFPFLISTGKSHLIQN